MKMKKLFMFAAIVAAMFASCTSDDLVDESVNNYANNDDSAIGFNIKVANTTRAAAADANHYEFGVYGYTGDDEATTSNVLMKNYLVGFGSENTTSYPSNTTPALYLSSAKASSTWGNQASGSLTDSRDGYSSWFYQGNTGTTYTAAQITSQILKYWDKSKKHTSFYAYTPYVKETEETGNNPTKIAFATSKDFTFTGLSSFYTTPVLKPNEESADYTTAKCYQVSTANLGAATSFTETSKLATYNKEIINYNEATYAYKDVAKDNYNKDVALDFKHLNARITLNFSCDVTGYTATILDMVPTAIAKGEGDNPDPAYDIAKQTGVVLTPSTQIQASTPMTVAQPAISATYLKTAELKAAGVDDTPTLSLTTKETDICKDNLYFASGKLTSDTWLYVIPNANGTSYLTGYPDDCKKTGYTLHVSYKLTPADDAADITVYDARVWIPADKCMWTAGKAYTYKIRITNASTGTTDPNNEPDPNKETEPYVDPTDPRVPDDPALCPIVFDGVEVTDYTTEDVSDFEL